MLLMFEPVAEDVEVAVEGEEVGDVLALMVSFFKDKWLKDGTCFSSDISTLRLMKWFSSENLVSIVFKVVVFVVEVVAA